VIYVCNNNNTFLDRIGQGLAILKVGAWGHYVKRPTVIATQIYGDNERFRGPDKTFDNIAFRFEDCHPRYCR